MGREELEVLLARASRLDENKMGYLTKEEREKKIRINGAKTFKRKSVGWFGRETVKTLDEMAQLLYSTGVVSSLDEGRKITPSLVGGEVRYGLCNTIVFNEVENVQGEKRYRISAGFHAGLS